MTETTPSDPPPEAAPGPLLAVLPADILMNLIVTLLAPMFLTASGGDIGFASMAALETVNSYRVRNLADLIVVAQIVAYGLAALGSLSLSMDDGISLPMILRLRGNANACTRSAEHNRRALEKARSGDRESHQAAPTQDPADAQYEAEVMANLAETKKLIAETMTRLQPAEPAAEPIAHPAPIPATTQVLTLEDRQRQAAWADVMTDVAAEFTAGVAHLPLAERQEASHRAALLTSCANQLLSGTVPPRLMPDDLDALSRRPNAV
jgi:hypothetical protein